MRTALLAPSFRLLLGVAVVSASAITFSGCGEEAAPVGQTGAAPKSNDEKKDQDDMQKFMDEQSKKK